MDEIARVEAVFAHKQPDRLPQCNFFTDGFIQEHGGADKNLYVDQGYGIVPLFSNLAPDAIKTDFKKDKQGIFTDGWGRQCKRTAASGFIEVLKYAPFALENLPSFRWDDPALPERFEQNPPGNIHHPTSFSNELEMHGDSAFLCCNVYDPFETLARVIGLKNALMSTKTDTDKLKPALAHLGSYMRELGEAQLKFGKGKIKGIWIWGDVAYTRGLMMAPELYRELILPPLKEMCSAFKEHDVKIIYHTDGNPLEILDDLAKAGIDGLHPVEQVPGMELDHILDEFGSKLTFIGGLPPLTRSIDEPMDQVKDLLSKATELGGNGGFIPGFTNFIPPGFDIDILSYITKYLKVNSYTK